MEKSYLKNLAYVLGIGILLLIVVLVAQNMAGTTESLEINKKAHVEVFVTSTCPYCRAEKAWLAEFQEDYPSLEVALYNLANEEVRPRLFELAEKHPESKQYLGSVPLTYIGEDFFLGFNEEIGENITNSLKTQFPEVFEKEKIVSSVEKEVPDQLKGKWYEDFSLPALAVVLGFFDGFNICSLGALALILGLILKLKSRKNVLIYGGIFVLTTAVVYGLLIVFWNQLFVVLSSYLPIMQFLIALIGIVGGIYFFKEFLRFRKYGPTCDATGGSLVNRVTGKVQKAFENPGNVLIMAGSVLLFAGVITIVEFPCSAAIPVMFAGILSQSGLSFASQFGLIGLFLLFYLIDELVIFGIAVWKMTVWLASSPKFVTWFTLLEALFLLGIGIYYLLSFF